MPLQKYGDFICSSGGEKQTRTLFITTPALSFFLNLFISTLFILSFPVICNADKSTFRDEFISNYKGFNFKVQENLIKQNKEIMQDEIRNLIDDAMSDDKTLGHRMYLLDIASAMSSGYIYIHGGGKELDKEIKRLIDNELIKEKLQNAELMKWEKDEKFLGNFVMKEHMPEMEQEKLAPVIYPHWVHRIWFECKVCHQDIFTMRRWQNDISHKKFLAGKQCGLCHNGEMAFATDEKCDACHIAGKPEAVKLYNADKIDHTNIKRVAEQLGARWNFRKLPDGKVPVDRLGFIDWLNLKENEVFKPINSLNDDVKSETRDNRILFVSKSKLKNVIFDHKVHSEWIKCSSCHSGVFHESLNNEVKMTRMSKGEFCGHCHGKVSFSFSDCLRCHNQDKNAPVKDALLHHGSDE